MALYGRLGNRSAKWTWHDKICVYGSVLKLDRMHIFIAFIVVEQPPGEKSPVAEESLFKRIGPPAVLELLSARQRVR